jgi:hypothetical protein
VLRHDYSPFDSHCSRSIDERLVLNVQIHQHWRHRHIAVQIRYDPNQADNHYDDNERPERKRENVVGVVRSRE